MEMEEEDGSKELLDECWEMIFNRLKHESDRESITLVCKRFLSISNSLRLCINLSDHTPNSIIPKLLQRFSNLKKIKFCNDFRGDLNEAVVAISRSGLDLEELSALSDRQSQGAVWLEELGSNMKNLKVLKITGGEGDADFVRVAELFPKLEEMYIGKDRLNMTDEGMDHMSSNLNGLRKVDLWRKEHISDKSLVSLSKNCPLLEHVKISNYNFITQKGISFLVNNSHNLKLLYICKSLNIDSFGVNGSSNFPTNLRSLRLEYVDISDEFLFSITEARIHLTNLALCYCRGYTFAGLSKLLQHSSQSLNSLELERFMVAEFLTNEHIEYLSSFLQNLTSIKLIGCSNLSDSAFVMITQRCPRLCHFVMTGSSLGREEYNYDGLMQKNRAMKYLDLSSHDEFRPTALKRLLNICPGVEKLKLHKCQFIPDDDQLNIPDILECSRRLVELDLTESCNITGEYMELESSVLEKLILKSSVINDILLIKFGRICPGLMHLDLSYCSEVTEEGIKEVVKLCKRLRYLSLSCCEKVGINIIPWIVANRPSLRKLVSSSCNYPDDENQKLFLQQGCFVLKDPNYIPRNQYIFFGLT